MQATITTYDCMKQPARYGFFGSYSGPEQSTDHIRVFGPESRGFRNRVHIFPQIASTSLYLRPYTLWIVVVVIGHHALFLWHYFCLDQDPMGPSQRIGRTSVRISVSGKMLTKKKVFRF